MFSDAAVAHHEASHAVVEMALGAQPPLWITIVSSDACRGRVMSAQMPIDFENPTKNTESSVLRFFAMCYAGALGQMRFLVESGEPFEMETLFDVARGDRASAKLVIERPYLLPGVDLTALHDRAMVTADVVLTEHWPAVERVAAGLLEHGKLTSAQIEAAYRREYANAA